MTIIPEEKGVGKIRKGNKKTPDFSEG